MLRKQSLDEDLIVALQEKRMQDVRILLEQGADPNAKDWGSETEEPFWQRLMKLFRKPSEADDKRPRALYRAACAGRKEGIDLLLKHGAPMHDPSDRYNHLVLVACFSGNAEIMRLFLENGFDPNEKDDYGTPLDVAISRDNPEMVRVLVEHGADLRTPVFYTDARFNQRSGTPLAAARSKKNPKIIDILKRAGAPE